MLIIYSLTIFSSALLLFLIQPMFARMLVPMLGGAPAVWNTALVFYQAALLGGYAYAHASTRWLGVRRQSILHMCVMLAAVLLLPIRVPSDWTPPSQSNPVPWLLALLTAAVGLPFFVVSATSPLLQKWFSATRHRRSSDPYFLYAASNLGSMVALLAYPIMVEPTLRLDQQGRWWAIGYGALVVMMAGCAAFLVRAAKSLPQSNPDPAPGELLGPGDASRDPRCAQTALTVFSGHPRLRWILLAFVPSSLMMSVTTHLTTDIAAVPLLWVIPLAIYLLTFILVFAERPLVPHSWMVSAMPFTALALVVALAARVDDPIWLVLPMHLVAFFVIAMVCHGELARSRPPARDLTMFYLYISVGGVLGGVFNALVAPVLFHSIAEYPIGVALAFLLLPGKSPRSRRSQGRVLATPARDRWLDVALPIVLGLITILLMKRILGVNPNPGLPAAMFAFGMPALVSLAFIRRPLRLALSAGAILIAAGFYAGNQGQVLFAERSFFGVTKVARDPSGQVNWILHGSTLHGGQWVSPYMRRKPFAYYDAAGPLGQFFDAFSRTGRLKNVAVVGLGSGVISCYAKPGQKWTYYEIDPLVERLARDSRYFTYLQDCEAEVSVVLGDGRLSLAAAPDGLYDVIIMDAYNSDAIPMHMLTRDALRLYIKKLAPAGVLVFHISNRYLDLEPVLANLAREAGLCARMQNDGAGVKSGSAVGKFASRYMVLSLSQSDLGSLAYDSRWLPAKTQDNLGSWSDNYSSIIRIFKWHR